MVKLYLAIAGVEALVYAEAGASVGGKRVSHILGIWERARKVKVGQEDASMLIGNFIVNTLFKVMVSA